MFRNGHQKNLLLENIPNCTYRKTVVCMQIHWLFVCPGTNSHTVHTGWYTVFGPVHRFITYLIQTHIVCSFLAHKSQRNGDKFRWKQWLIGTQKAMVYFSSLAKVYFDAAMQKPAQHVLGTHARTHVRCTHSVTTRNKNLNRTIQGTVQSNI